MAKIKNLNLTESETWTVHLSARDAAGTAYDLTGGNGQWGFSAEGGALLLSVAGTIIDGPAGLIDFVAAPGMHAVLVPGEYLHEIRVTLPDTTVSTQVRGRLTVVASPF